MVASVEERQLPSGIQGYILQDELFDEAGGDVFRRVEEDANDCVLRHGLVYPRVDNVQLCIILHSINEMLCRRVQVKLSELEDFGTPIDIV